MELVILIPVLQRIHRVRPVVESISLSTHIPHKILFLLSPNFRGELQAIKPLVRITGNQVIEYYIMPTKNPIGDYAKKINKGYEITSEPYLFLGADDLNFHRNWYRAAKRKMVDGIGVVGTNDLGNSRVLAGTHSTHSLVSREYVDKFGTLDEAGKVLYEGYVHEYVDDEFIGTAKKRKMFAFAADSIVEHLHPNWGKAIPDPIYEGQRRRMHQSRRLYEERRKLWM